MSCAAKIAERVRAYLPILHTAEIVAEGLVHAARRRIVRMASKVWRQYRCFESVLRRP